MKSTEVPLYFAYGSNLKAERLIERVGPASAAGRARLADHGLSFKKRGGDGSGKACFEAAPGQTLWGVVYALTSAQFETLDRFERGYRRIEIAVRVDDEELKTAITYQAERFTDDPTPYDWYVRLIVEGAREHGLPSAWQAMLDTLPARPQPARPSATR